MSAPAVQPGRGGARVVTASGPLLAGAGPANVGLVLLLGLVGGLAMGSIAAARRTASSFTTFWTATNPSDIDGATGLLNPGLEIKPYDPPIITAIAALPRRQRRREPVRGLNILPLLADGAPRPGHP